MHLYDCIFVGSIPKHFNLYNVEHPPNIFKIMEGEWGAFRYFSSPRRTFAVKEGPLT